MPSLPVPASPTNAVWTLGKQSYTARPITSRTSLRVLKKTSIVAVNFEDFIVFLEKHGERVKEINA